MTRLLVILFSLLLVSCSQKTKSIDKDLDYLKYIKFLQKTDNIQLAPALVSVDSILFVDKAKVSVDFEYPNAEINYTLNDGMSQKYIEPIYLDKSSKLKFQASAPGFKTSETQTVQVFKVSKRVNPEKIKTFPDLDETYPGDGVESFFDLKKGTLNFRAGHWLGFQSEGIIIIVDFEKAIPIEKVKFSLLSDHNAWIFLPKSIRVKDHDYVIGRKDLNEAIQNTAASLEFVELEIEAGVYKHLEFFIQNFKEIPEWHQGKGTSPWIFIDEIIIE